jgi:hypothetical protein
MENWMSTPFCIRTEYWSEMVTNIRSALADATLDEMLKRWVSLPDTGIRNTHIQKGQKEWLLRGYKNPVRTSQETH